MRSRSRGVAWEAGVAGVAGVAWAAWGPKPWTPTGCFPENCGCKSDRQCWLSARQILDYLRDEPMCMSVMGFLDWVNRSGNIHATCRCHCSMDWGLGLTKKGEGKLSTTILLSLPTVPSCLTPASMPSSHEGLDSQTVSQINPPFILLLLSSIVTTMRKWPTQRTSTVKCWLFRSHVRLLHAVPASLWNEYCYQF